MIVLKSLREIDQMRRVNAHVAEILDKVKSNVRPGVSTGDLEEIVEEEVRKRGIVAAFKGVQNPHGVAYKWCICASVNDEVVHGVPSNHKVLKEGDLLSVDFGVKADGFYGDAAFSKAVGIAGPKVERIIKTVNKALEAGIYQAREGQRLGDLGSAVQDVAESAGYNVVHEFVGHGIGRQLHEEPQVPNFGTPGKGIKLKVGMVLAIEPMINDGGPGIKVDTDGWTARTRDGSLAAHAEHSVAITKDGPMILSRLG